MTLGKSLNLSELQVCSADTVVPASASSQNSCWNDMGVEASGNGEGLHRSEVSYLMRVVSSGIWVAVAGCRAGPQVD